MSSFSKIENLAKNLRQELNNKKCILLFAYNGTGKTRLSMAFKDEGKQYQNGDTLYFNAFTEDLFSWDNDLDNDFERVLKLNSNSRFFSGLEELEMETRIKSFLNQHADFDFIINYKNWTVQFFREIETQTGSKIIDHIKVSRGEENIFIWCFFLSIVQLAMDGVESYKWVKYIFIDDPISSLDEQNAISVANQLAKLLKDQNHTLKIIISSHHTLFFNVLHNEFSNANKYFLSRSKNDGTYTLKKTNDTPFFYHISILKELYQAAQSGKLYTYHFNILRTVLEKSANFHGFRNFSACIKQDGDDPDGALHARLINILSHGNYSLYEPREMLEENKAYFKKILNHFLDTYSFNTELFQDV